MVPAAVSFPPVSAIVEEPASAVSMLVEPHVPVRPFGLSTATPAGSVSVNATPLRALVFGLVIVNESAVVPPDPIEAGVNALLSVGGFTAALAAAGSATNSAAAAMAALESRMPTPRRAPTPELNILACVLTSVPFRRSNTWFDIHPVELGSKTTQSRLNLHGSRVERISTSPWSGRLGH